MINITTVAVDMQAVSKAHKQHPQSASGDNMVTVDTQAINTVHLQHWRNLARNVTNAA